MIRAFRNPLRTFGALLFALLASTALASARIQANKSFSPNSVALGGVSNVTVTLQNDSTSSAATITTFSDDIGTTMAGHATLLSSPAPATTCPGGTPSIAGQVLSMNNGQIPIAPSTSAPGVCTVTFSVAGALAGNGFNTIHAADVVTSLGSPGADVTQTLNVQSTNVTTSATGFGGSVQTGDTATVSFVLTNPATIPLTSTTFGITSSASAIYTLSGYTTTCGGTAGLPAAGTSGTASFSGLTIPASGSCTVTLNVTSPNATTVTLSLAANAVTDAQGASDATGASTSAKFITGQPTVSKSFSPSAIAAGGSTTLTFNVQNTLVTKPLTNAAISDTLPAGLTISGTPTANSFCGSPTLGVSGTGTLTFSGGTIAINHICTITATVNVPSGQAAGTVTNSVPAGNFTSTEATGATGAATANLVVTAAGGGMTISQSATPTSGTVNAPLKISLSFVSVGTALSGGTFTDVLPQTAATMAVVTSGGAYAPTFSFCGSGSPTVTFGGTGGNTTVSGSNLAISSGGTCTVSFYVAFTAAVGATKLDTNTLVASNVSFTGSSGAISPPTNASVSLSEVPTFSINNYLASNSGLAGQQLTVAATLYDSSGTADTSAVMVVNLTAGHVALAAVPNFTFTGCPAGFGAGNITIGGSRESFTATLGSINATCSIGYDVIDEGGASGTWAPANSSYSSTLTGGTAVGSTALNSVTFATSSINITKAFSPNQIQSGGVSTADITLTVPQAGTIARTQANGVAFSDALPANVTFSPTPNVTFTGCQQTGQSAPIFSIAGTTISISNASLVTVGATQTACDVKFDVTSSVVGAPLNQIAASAVTSTSGITNSQNALASLTVNSGLGIAKTFLNPSFQIGGTDYVRFLVTNSASSTALTGGTIVDAMPSTLVLASATLGAIQSGDPALCGGSVAGPVGTGTLNLSGLAVAALTGPTTPGQCVVYVQVKASGSAAPGSVSNTVAAGGLNVGGYINQVAATGSVGLTAAPNTTVSKTFSPALIAPGAASVLSIVIDNTAAGSPALSGMALTDTLPTGVRVAATPNSSTTCGAGTVTAVAASASVALVSGGVAANATCTITVSVTGTTGGTYTNTIAANALTTTQGATNAAAATANLTIASITLSKVFAPASIAAGGTSTLTITIPNGPTALTGVALTDTWPAGVTIAATPNAVTTCPSGTVAATAGGANVALSGGALAANATCTISVDVTGTTAGTYTNTIGANALTTAQSVTNTAAATANLTITPAGLTLSKTFAPASIVAGGTSTLTITIPNTASGAVSLSGVGLTDALPTGVTIAATPNAVTTCPSGTLTATAGGTSVVLAGGTLVANATCTISVSVTGTVAASYTNTIPATSLTTTQGVTNATAATANLTVTPGSVTLSKAFAPASIVAGGTSTLTITIPNTASGSVSLSGVGLTDALPTGVTIAATPNAATTCPSGSLTATAGGTSVALAGATLVPNATCTISLSVTGTIAASYTNTIPATSLLTTQGVTNATAATANLAVTPASITLSKAFAPAAILAGTASTLTITIPNTSPGAVLLSGVALTDTLPTGVTIAATPNATTTCPSGAVAATAGGASIALTGGTLAANATCTIDVRVTGTVVGSYLNTIATNALNTTQTVTNQTPATATLDITAVPDVTLTKAFSPATVAQGSTSLLTITVNNTATSSVPLTGLAFTDAYPAGLMNAATPAGVTTCPAGSVLAAAGSGALELLGATLAANASCTITVRVDAPAGTYSNTLSSVTTTQGATNAAAATATLSVTAPPDTPTITNAFSPPSILSGGLSTLTVTIANTGTNAVALTTMALTDTLLAGVTIAPVPNAATTCPSGVAGGSPGGSALTLGGASLAAGVTCTLTVQVTSASIGAHTNTIAANALTDTQLLSNAVPAAATLTVGAAPAVTLTQVFAPSTIVAGATSVLTLSIANTATGAVPLTGIALTDPLPAGLVLAAIPNASTTCPSANSSAVAGAASFAISGAMLGANATCTLSVTVTGSAAGVFSNGIAAGVLTSTQGATNAATTATLTLTALVAPPLVLSKTFAPVSIVSGGVSTLTVTIANTGSGAIALTSLAFADTLPAGVIVAAVPNSTTTCGAGTVTATAGGTALSLANASLAGGATCTVSVRVTSGVPGPYVDTSAVGAVSDTQNVSNSLSASASLNVTAAPAVILAQAFAPAAIFAGATSVLTLTFANTTAGAVPLSGVALVDALPTGLVIAATPNATTTCMGASVSAAANATTFALSAGSLAVNASCTISLNVLAASAGVYTNAIAAAAMTSLQGATNAASQAILTVTAVPVIGLTQAFVQPTIVAGADSVLTLVIANSAAGAVALGGMGLTDTLPVGVVLAATPNASTTCPGGAVSAVAGSLTFALSAATLAANASCTIVVTVTASSVGGYVNAVAAAAVTDTQRVTNAASTATLTVTAAAALHLTKTSDVAGAAVFAGQTVAYTIAIVNAGTTRVTGAKLTDVLTNGSLVSGSVSVNGAAAADAVVKSGATFGSIAAGATVTIRYRATVAANAASGVQLTNSAMVGSDQSCAGSACSASALPDVVSSPPKVDVTLLIDGKLGETVTLGQVVTYTAIVSNVGGSSARDVTFSDTLPVGVTPIAGSLTSMASAARDAAARSSASVRAGTDTGVVTTSSNGQTVEASLGTLAVGASSTVTFRATITQQITTVATNTVTIGASGIANSVTSNPVAARMVKAQLTVTKTASAVVAQIGDRVDYVVHVALPAGIAFGKTTIVDQLPNYLLFAPGSARLNGVASVPAVSGHTLTWTLAALGAPLTLTYATSIAAGASANATLTNLVAVNATASGAGPAGGGSASVALQVAPSTFGTCYPITGRVYDDAKHSGRFEAGDAGLAGVSIVLDDGESVVTDSYGRYNFPCVRQGMHALRLDEQTLPAGSIAYPDRAIDSERSTRRLVHGIFDDTILQDINFAIGQVTPGTR